MVFARDRDGGVGGKGELLLGGFEVSVTQDEPVLEISCTILCL